MPEAGARRRAETLGIPVFRGVIWADNSEGDRKTGRVLYSQWGRLPDLQHLPCTPNECLARWTVNACRGQPEGEKLEALESLPRSRKSLWPRKKTMLGVCPGENLEVQTQRMMR